MHEFQIKCSSHYVCPRLESAARRSNRFVHSRLSSHLLIEEFWRIKGFFGLEQTTTMPPTIACRLFRSMISCGGFAPAGRNSTDCQVQRKQTHRGVSHISRPALPSQENDSEKGNLFTTIETDNKTRLCCNNIALHLAPTGLQRHGIPFSSYRSTPKSSEV
jgi:hypothetical protein